MNTFKHKSLYVALASVATLGVTDAAQAVSVNPEGLGQVLIYPYYTVRDKVAGAPFNSLLSVVNSTASAKGVKVRFIEGKASKEVLDFNLYLSPKDVWTAALIPHGTGAAVITRDTSCTQPKLNADVVNPLGKFVNYAYDGDAVGDDSLDRTKEGYVEIIEMGNISNTTAAAAITHATSKTGEWVPPNCDFAFAETDFTGGNGGLFGGMTIINVLAGEDFSTDAVALAGFSQVQLYRSPGDVRPNLADVNPPTSYVLDGNTVTQTPWSEPIDAVSAIFMHDAVLNEFVLDAGTLSGTDFVMTMPTKWAYFDEQVFTTPQGEVVIGVVQKLFQRNLTTSGACDDVSVTQYDREERAVKKQTSFSPPPPDQKDKLCWEASIVTFNNSNVFGSKNSVNLATTFENGWVNITFPSDAAGTYHTLVAPNGTTFSGLPVIGFAAQTFNNGLKTDSLGRPVQSQYGGSFSHRYTRNIDIIN